MTIKWKVSPFSNKPKRISVISETAHRERNDGVYNTFEEAKATIIARILREISSLESQINHKRIDLNKVCLLTKPTIPQEES